MAQATVEILIRAQENVSQAVNQVKQQLDGLSQHAQAIFGRLTQFYQQNEEALNTLAKTGALVAGTLTALAAVGARYSNQLREEALQIGTTIEKYSLYRVVLEDLEIRAEMLPMFIMRMQVAFQQAAAAVAMKGEKVNELTMALAVLGQTVQTQTNDPIEQMVLLLKEIAKIPDQAQQAAIMFELFGRRAYALLPILREGSDEIDNLIEKYQRLGVTISDEVSNKIDDMSDAFAVLMASLKALSSDALANVAPTLEKVAESINKITAAIKAFGEEQPTFASFVSHILLLAAALGGLTVLLSAVGHGIKWIADGLRALGALKILDWLKGLVGGFGSLRAALAAVGGAINPVVLAITAIATAIGGLIKKIEDATGALSRFLAKLMTTREARKYVDETVTDIEYTAEQRERDKAELERFYRERPYLRQLEQQYAQRYYGKVGALSGFEAPRFEMPQLQQQDEKERKAWEDWRERMLRLQQDLQSRWSDYIETLKKQWQDWFNYRKQFYEDIKHKYYEWVDKQKEAVERITRAEEEMRSRMAEAYESAARLAANLAARAGVYHIRFGAFGQFAIPVVQEAQPVAYTPSREEMTLSYTAYIYFYAQQIWLSIQNIIVLLQQAVGHLSLIAQAVAKSAGGATLNVNVPFGYDQIRNAIADAVNEAVGKQLAHELVRNV